MSAYDVDPSNTVSVRWVRDDEPEFGQLVVRAVSKGFAGESKAWFDASTVRDFAVGLTTYPPAEEATSIAGGIGSAETGDEYESLRVDVRPVGGRGQISVHVYLASPWPEFPRPDAKFEVRLELLTTFERLRSFAEDLLLAVNGEIPQASLGAEELA